MALSGIEVIGKIIKVYDPKSGISKRNGSEWKSQEFVIEEQGGNSSFPRMCDFTVFGADRLDQFKINLGETVHVWLDINAHAWEDRYFNDVRAYRVEHVDPNSVGMPNGGYAQLNAVKSKSAATQMKLGSRTEGGIMLLPTSYTAEMFAPALKKYVAVTAAPSEAAKDYANSATNMNQILDGRCRGVMFRANAKGLYEISYS